MLGGTSIILIIIYLCIKWEKCFCNYQKDDHDPEYSRVDVDESADGTEGSRSPAPSGMLSEKTYAMSTGDLKREPMTSSDEDFAPGVAQIGEIVSDDGTLGSAKLPRKSLKKKQKQGLSQSMESVKKDLGHLQLTLQYSKKDLFLFIVIHKISRFCQEQFPGIGQIRISMVLLPTKKNRHKTKFVPVTDEPEFGSSFRFSNVSRADLFRSALRFRLYGKHVRLGMQLGMEKLMGEVTVHLADVAQKEQTTTSRPFVIMNK